MCRLVVGIVLISVMQGCVPDQDPEGVLGSSVRKYDHVTALDRARWEGVAELGLTPRKEQLLVKTAEVEPIADKEAAELWDNLVASGAIRSDHSHRDHFTDKESPFRPFLRHRVVFTDNSEAAVNARKSEPSSHQVTRLTSVDELSQLGLTLEHIVYRQETPDGWSADWYDRKGQATDPLPIKLHRYPAYLFQYQGLPSMVLRFTKAPGSAIDQVKKVALFDSYSKTLLDQAYGQNPEQQKEQVLIHFSSFPIYHRTTIDVVLDYHSTGAPSRTVIAPAELGPLYDDDGNGGMVALLAKGSIGVMKDWMDGEEWGAFVSESPMMRSHYRPGFYFKTWPQEGAEAYSIELLAEDKVTVIPSEPNHDMNVKGLIYTVGEAKDFDRVRYFKIRHRRQHQRVVFPIETSWLRPRPKTGDLLDIEIPFAKVKDERFADWFMTRVAQLSLDAPHHIMLPGDFMSAPRDAVSKTFTTVTVREAMEEHAQNVYKKGSLTYDSEKATLHAVRR